MNKYIILVALMLASGFAGVQYNKAENEERVANLNAEIYNLGVIVQTETNKTAETNRQLKVANRDRINAIETNDHNANAIISLQNDLNESVRKLETLRNNHNFIVLDVGAVGRVYDEARNGCNGLPGTNDPAIVPAQLSEFTGDSITGVVRYLAGRYCEVAIDYNNLYNDSELLLAK